MRKTKKEKPEDAYERVARLVCDMHKRKPVGPAARVLSALVEVHGGEEFGSCYRCTLSTLKEKYRTAQALRDEIERLEVLARRSGEVPDSFALFPK